MSIRVVLATWVLVALVALPAHGQLIKHPPDIASTNLPTCDSGKEGRILALNDATDEQDCDSTGGGNSTAHCKCIQTGASTWAWAAVTPSGGGAFSDASDPIVPNTTTKDLALGTSAVNTSKLSVDGDADQVQFSVQGNATQTNDLAVLEQSDGTEVFTVDNSGNTDAAGSLSAGGTATPGFKLNDSDDTGTIDASIDVDCPTTNDCDMEFAVNSGADTETVMVKIDTTDAGASTVQLGTPGTNYINVDEAGAMTAVGTGSILATSYTATKCVTIESPLDADNFLLMRAEGAITVTGIDCLVNASTSAVITVQECDGNGGSCTAIEAAITCATTNTTEASGIDNAAVDAGDWIRIDVGTVTGSVGHVATCVTFTT